MSDFEVVSNYLKINATLFEETSDKLPLIWRVSLSTISTEIIARNEQERELASVLNSNLYRLSPTRSSLANLSDWLSNVSEPLLKDWTNI